MIAVEGLCIAARRPDGTETDIVAQVSFAAAAGEVVALIGESGSGKTTTGLALLGYTRPGCRIRAGRVVVGTTDVRALPPSAMPDFRGRRAAYIAQSAAAAFNPAQRLLDQVIEGSVVRGLMTRRAATARAEALFATLALPDPATIGHRYPHQVSGGQLQRVMAAMALMTDPELVVLDEPTSALDVTTQVEVLHAFRDAIRGRGTTAVFISHDLAVVAQLADRIVVLQNGRVQEDGATASLLAAPTHAYTRSLLAAAPTAHRVAAEPAQLAPGPAPPILEVRDLAARYGGARGVPALRDVSLRVAPGAVLGVIGESGSGKSTLARVLTGLLPSCAGSVTLDGATLPPAAADRTPEQLRRMQLVLQSADTALNPAHSIRRILERPLAFFGRLPRNARARRVTELLDRVQLPTGVAERRPADLSGGQKQRVNLARALAADPALLICDEVTSALDTVVGAAVLDLLAELRRDLGLAMIFISHDLATVRSIADDVMVMYAGRPVQYGPRSAATHPYAALLARSVPELRPGWLDTAPRTMRDAAPAWRMDDSCAFYERCDRRIPGRCDVQPTPVRAFADGTRLRCQHTEAELHPPVPAIETIAAL